MNKAKVYKQSQFFITHHKAASSFILSLLKKLSPYIGLDPVDPSLLNWKSKEPQKVHDVLKEYFFDLNGKIYMIRFNPGLIENPNFDPSKISGVVMVRDPRDTLVSIYFSVAYSHPKQLAVDEEEFRKRKEYLVKTGLNAYLQTESLISLRKKYEVLLDKFQNRPNILWTTYEKMVTKSDLWFDEIMEHFQWKISSKTITVIKKELKESFIVEKENPYAHKRKVTPGDWECKCTPQTKKYMKERLGDILILLGYEKDLDW